MKHYHTISRDVIVPPIRDPEFALFTCAIQSSDLRDRLAAMGRAMPGTFEVTHNTNPDDPPDFQALGLGWECTEFPPNQSAIAKVHETCGPFGMVIPGFSETGGDIRKIRKRSNPFSANPSFVSIDKEVSALEHAFVQKILSGPKSKDIFGNDILLLDHRGDQRMEWTEIALRRAIACYRPRHLRIIVVVGFRAQQPDDMGPVPQCLVVFP
jgi:hypothetical protein